ncbi:MAG: TerB family tellurite resistance protein [Myxococcales bacterium]|nr:TerB family tellurite resistance protein [Myxococcales bacterium]
MILKRLLTWLDDSDVSPAENDRVRRLVAEHLTDADSASLELVSAMTGLLAAVAYADREYTREEQEYVEHALRQIHGLDPHGVAAICAALREHIIEIAHSSSQAHTRAIRQHADRELRLEILDLLVDVAAADGTISMEETHWLRRATDAMGLTQDDYVASQTRHRERLSLLK